MEKHIKRGCILSGWLWLELIGNIINLIILWIAPISKITYFPNIPLSQKILLSIINLVFFISIMGIFRWKKFFIYVYIGATLLNFIATFIVQKFQAPIFISTLIGVLLNLWASYSLLILFKKNEINN